MTVMRRQVLRLAGGAVAVGLASRHAHAQAYPSRPVRVIVTTGPGGQGDTTARLVAAKLTESLGQSFYIENMPGGGGNIAMAATARAAPDGYTILAATSNIVTNISLYPKISYDPYKDFEPISLMCSSPHVLVVHPSIPAAERQRTGRAGEGEPRQIQLRLGRPRHARASGRRIVQAGVRRRHHARAVQRRRSGHRLHARRSRADRGVGGADGGDLYPRRPTCARSECSAASVRPRCRMFRP